MKKQLFILLVLVFTFSVSKVTLSQDQFAPINKTPDAFKLSSTDNDGILKQSDNLPIQVVLPNNGFFTSNPRCPQGGRRWVRALYVITAAELTASGFPAGAVSSVGWGYYANNTPVGSFFQNAATMNHVKVYLQLTSLTSVTTISPTWATAIGDVGVIKVCDGTITIPAGLGPYNIDVAAGGPGTGPFSTVAGMGVIVYVESETTTPMTCGVPNDVGAPSPYANAGAGTLMRYYQDGTACPAFNDTASSFMNFTSAVRPETRFGNALVDIADMPNLWYLGKVPYPWGWPDTICVNVRRLVTNPNPISIRVRIKNLDAPFITKFDTTIQLLRSLVQTPFDTIIAIQGLCYPYWKRDSILAEILPIPGEQVPGNNRKGGVQMQTCDSYNWRDVSHPPDGGVGVTGAAHILAACFRNTCPPAIPYVLACVDLSFTSIGEQYRVIVYGDGGGKPGAILHTSANQVTIGGNTPVQYKLPVPLTIPQGVFYIGVEQVGIVNYGLGYNSGLPKKGAVLFTLDGGVTWIDFNTDGDPFIVNICPKTWTTLTNKAFVEGFYLGNGVTRTGSMKMRIRSATTKKVVDSSMVPMSSAGVSVFKFCSVNCDSSYYWDLTSPCAVYVWSAQPQRFDVCDKQYNFSDALNKAYTNGFNPPMVQYPNDNSALVYALYTGDSNQDGCVGAGDISLIDNDVFNFAYHINTDVDGNGTVNATDLALADNNATNFICGQSHP